MSEKCEHLEREWITDGVQGFCSCIDCGAATQIAPVERKAWAIARMNNLKAGEHED